MMAPDALASSTSLSLMAPTPRCTTSTRTSGVLSCASASARASAGPPWSALMMIGRVVTCPSLSARLKSSSVPPRWPRRFCASRSSRCRFWAMSRASAASATTRNESPADGTPSKPRICTGIDGPADGHRVAALVEQRAHAAGELAADEVVADLQRAALHQQRGERALARIEGGLDDGALGPAVGVGLEVEDVGLEQDLLEQQVDAGALLGRDCGREDVAAELLEHDAGAAGGPASSSARWPRAGPSC